MSIIWVKHIYIGMKKRTLTEELERIHTITYGEKLINETNFLSSLMGGKSEQKPTDPKKADEVTDDVKSFFENLDKAKSSGGLSQQQQGSMTWQKEVESMQIGLMILGYDLPAHGVDGLYGPETQEAVKKFSTEKGIKSPTDNASAEFLDKLISELKTKGVTSQDLKSHINMVTSGGSAAFTDLDLTTQEGYTKYATICQKFIENRPPNLLNIRGEMLANAAKTTFERYHKYVPPELALAQLAAEGGIGNRDPQSRPIRTRNPYNVGNTDNGSNISHNSVESGIQTYYDLIARNYLGNGKTANDLIQNFVNKDNQRYASGGDYEAVLNKIAGEANRIGQTVVPRSNVDMSTMA
jgi:peptidoglycan hydrolase-like protein with peptidoglycan-binding domain